MRLPMKSLFLVAAVGCSLASCSAGQDRAVAESGVAEFRRMMDAGRYREIYSGAAADFRQVSSEQTALRFLEMVGTRLGPVRQATQQGWNVNVGTGGHMVTLNYATEFTRGRGTESFVFRVEGERAKLAGYHVNSMDLMMGDAPPQPSGEPAKPAN
jgi:hypothetical protein